MMKKTALLAAAFLGAASATVADVPAKRFVILADFATDNPLRDPQYAVRAAEQVQGKLKRAGLGFLDEIILRAATGQGLLPPADWAREVTLTAQGIRPENALDHLARLFAGFGEQPLPQGDTGLIWTIEDMGLDGSSVPTLIIVLTNGVGATWETNGQLVGDKLAPETLAGCAISWVGIGVQGGAKPEMRRALDALFEQISKEAGATDVDVQH